MFIEHTPEIKEVIDNWDLYFSFDRIDTLVDNADGRMYPNIAENNKRVLYRKGIRCQYEGISLYHYDLENYTINESRIIENSWNMRRHTARYLVEHATKEIAETIMSKAFRESALESVLEYNSDTWGCKMSEGWRDAIGKKIIVNEDLGGFYIDKISHHEHFLVSKELGKKIKASFPDVETYGIGDDAEVYYEKVNMSPKVSYQIKKATEALTEMKYSINYPIEVVKFSDSSTLGLAKDNTIFLSEKVFEKGLREVVLTIMEENEHLVTNYSDKTRQFQDHLFAKWLTSMEEQHGIFL